MLLQLQIFTEFIKKHALADHSTSILLAVSGGKDSVVMTHLFHKAGFKVAIAHCNFNLRAEESKRDEDFVRNLAKKLNIPFHLANFDTKAYADEHKISTQMAARDLRYNFFEEICKQHNYAKLATAHHANDAMETVLLNIIRGTGIAGLHGISKERDYIIRPLLCFKRQDIDDIISHNNLNFVEDSSNASDKYVRNKIRLNIIPEMKKINPSLEQTFDQNINYFSKLEDFVKEQIANYKLALFEQYNSGIKINIAKLLAIKNLEFVLTELLMPYGFNPTSINDLINALGKESGKTFLSTNYELVLDREYVLLSHKKDNFYTEIEFNSTDEFVFFGEKSIHKKNTNITEFEITKDSNTCLVDSDKLIFPLKIRNWKLGDRFSPLGMKGQKKLSDYFINQKIPLSEKKNIAVMENGDGKIIWVIGYRLDERFKITDETKKLTTFEYKV